VNKPWNNIAKGVSFFATIKWPHCAISEIKKNPEETAEETARKHFLHIFGCLPLGARILIDKEKETTHG
jgi:hypothetical protein